MGAKLSTQISRKKKYFSSKPKKTYNFDSNSIHYTEKEQESQCTSGTDSFITSGRTFHHVQNSAYWFPNDNEEMDRLIGQHFALKTLFKGNIMNQIVEELDLENDSKVILDVGCGPGTWLMDIATEYPSSEFIGVDMCDVFPNNIRPQNVSFQVGNVLERLPFMDNTFDFVNIRLFIIALKKYEWPIVMQEIHRILKPGGFIQIVECGMLERGSEFIKSAGKIFKEVIDGRGQDPYISLKLKPLLENQGFSVRHYENKDVHLGRPDALSKEFLWDACAIFKSAQPVLQEPLGYNSDTYPEFLDHLYIELQKKPEAMWSLAICVGQK